MEGIFSKIKAVIFDMDGVLIDSEPVMAKAAARAFNDEGIPAKESDFEQVRGDFESNPFVRSVLDHISAKTELGRKAVAALNNQ